MKKLTNKKTLITAFCAILVVVAMVFTFTACDGNKDKEPATTEPTSIEAPVSTTETVKPIEDETTSETETSTTEELETETPETTKTQNSGSSGNSGNGGGSSSGGNTYKPTEAPKPTSKPTEAPTKAPETTKKQETKPVVNQNDDVEVKDKDREEVPTYADGSFDMGAMVEQEGPGTSF